MHEASRRDGVACDTAFPVDKREEEEKASVQLKAGLNTFALSYIEP